jgi:hypothetical protein
MATQCSIVLEIASRESAFVKQVFKIPGLFLIISVQAATNQNQTHVSSSSHYESACVAWWQILGLNMLGHSLKVEFKQDSVPTW